MIVFKFWPLMVRVSDAPRFALMGFTLVITGGAAPRVNALIMEANWPSGFVT